jgi:Zn-dependent peptidase ImmA (M78 family)
MLADLHGKAKEIERSAVRIRKFAGLPPYEKLDPYELAAKLGMRVISVKELSEASIETAKTLLIKKAHEWSGASSGVLADGAVIILLNTTQSERRQAATLMEEICHVLLGHELDRLPISGSGSQKRDYNLRQESEAYAVGAAALVPYIALKQMLDQGRTLKETSLHFGVTQALVQYRAKFTDLIP